MEYPRFGQDKLQGWLETEHRIHLSTATINRMLHAQPLIKPRKKRWPARPAGGRAKQELSQLRKTLKAFEKFQLDVKQLDDIETLWPGIYKNRLPQFQYTLRDIATATTFVAFAYERSITNSMRFPACRQAGSPGSSNTSEHTALTSPKPLSKLTGASSSLVPPTPRNQAPLSN